MELLEDTAAQLLERLGEDPPSFDLLYGARDWLMEKGVDAVGFRVDGSAGCNVGANVTVDFVHNFHTGENDWFMSLGGQAATEGASGSVGVLLVWGLPDNGGYGGWSVGGTGSIAEGFVGVDLSIELGLEPYKGENATTLYIAYAAGEEVTAGLTGSYTWSLEEVLQLLGIE